MRLESPEPNRAGTAIRPGFGDGASGAQNLRSGLRSLAMAAFALLSAPPIGATVPADLLYFSVRNTLAVMDLDTGSVTWLEPQVADFKGLTFDPSGKLLTTVDLCVDPDSCFQVHHVLAEVDPLTGEIREEIGDVRDASGAPIVVVALAAKPDADLLYGLGGAPSFPSDLPAFLKLWSIDPSTGVASLIGSPAGCPEIGCPTPVTPFTGFSGLDFGPDGTLHATLAVSNDANLFTLDADTGALLSSQLLDRTLYGNAPLAVRSDDTLFTHSAAVLIRPPPPCRTCPPPPPVLFPSYLATVDESTGVVTEIGPGVAHPAGFPPTDLAFSPLVVLSIDIDIRPLTRKNRINPMGRGSIPVAILGSDDFDVAELDRATLAFGPAGAPPVHRPHLADVNRDDRKDLIAFFETDSSGIAFGDSEACLTGELLDGTPVEGCDAILTVRGVCGRGFELALLLPAAVRVRRRRKVR